MKNSKDLDTYISHAIERDGPVTVDSCGQSAEDLFLTSFAALIAKFGCPDFPSSSLGPDWRSSLGLNTTLLGVWDFDYYKLTLRLEDGFVLIEKHS